MNKEQAKERLCAIETEVEKLRRIIDEPEPRKPAAGDVHEMHCGSIMKLGGGKWEWIGNGENQSTSFEDKRVLQMSMGYLGKFDEVFVKISDVRDALSIVDKDGDDTIGLLQSFDCNQWGAAQTAEALRKLNIITD